MIRKIYRSLLSQRHRQSLHCLRQRILPHYYRKSYSQNGEDLVLAALMKPSEPGFYVDVGAHHPRRFSNTCYFYERGWRGINIDALPGSMIPFRRERKRDINLEMGISKTGGELTYFNFTNPAYNGFSVELSAQRKEIQGLELVETVQVETHPLGSVLHQHLMSGQRIDFLSVDVEGFDLAVLESNDWNAFRPKLIVVEINFDSLEGLMTNPITECLKGFGYRIASICYNSVIFSNKKRV